jgi:hypothetical protein
MDSQIILKITFLCLVFGTGIAIPVSIAWLEHRTRTRGLDTLRIYAERCEEPPASVIEAVTRVTNVWGRPPHAPPSSDMIVKVHADARATTWPMPPQAPSSPAGLWWSRVSAYDEKGAGIVIGSLAALFFAGSVAARLVYAYYARDK